MDRTGNSSYTVEFEGGVQEVHLDDLKEYLVEEFKEEGVDLWYSRNPNVTPRDEEIEVGVVEKIVGHRRNENGRLEFLVKWVGFDSTQNTWEHPGNLFKCPWGLMTYCGENSLVLDGLDMAPKLS